VAENASWEEKLSGSGPQVLKNGYIPSRESSNILFYGYACTWRSIMFQPDHQKSLKKQSPAWSDLGQLGPSLHGMPSSFRVILAA
jgi:hypothetical protein